MHSKMSSAICFNMDQSKILSAGNGLNLTVLDLSQVGFINEADYTKQSVLSDL